MFNLRKADFFFFPTAATGNCLEEEDLFSKELRGSGSSCKKKVCA